MGFNFLHYGEFSQRNNVKTNTEKKEDRMCVDLPLPRIRMLLACLGAIPCLLERPYWPSCSVRRSSFLYCITIYIIASSYVVWVCILWKQEYSGLDESQFIARTTKIENLLLLLPHILGFVLWFDVKNIAFTMKCFTKVQDAFQKATGKKLLNRRNRLEKTLITLVISLPILIFCMALVFIEYERDSAYMGPSILYGNITLITLSTYFIGISLRISDAAEDMRKEFEKHLTKRDLTATMVFDCRLAWLSMRKVLDSMGALRSTQIAHSVGLMLTVVMLYEGATMFNVGQAVAAVAHVIASVFYISIVVFSCTASHYAQEKMKNLVGGILPTIKLSSYDIGIQREIVMLYLIESARPAVTNLGGMVVVNKHLIAMFWSNVLTYIIVLFQFFQTNSFAI